MMAKTHMLTGFAYGVAVYPAVARGDYTIEQYALVMVGLVIGSLLPDIDHPHSLISQFIPIVGGVMSRLTKHRGLFHSIVGVVLVYAVLVLVSQYVNRATHSQLQYFFVAGALIGYVLHIIGDVLTVSGVQLFYPLRYRVRIPVIRTNGYRELILQVSLLVVIAVEVLSYVTH